jgi:hypothetical protein
VSLERMEVEFMLGKMTDRCIEGREKEMGD